MDRAFSHYQHNVGLGVEELGFDEALALELQPFELLEYPAFTRRGTWDGPPISIEARHRLSEHFVEPNRRLEKLLGRTLPR